PTDRRTTTVPYGLTSPLAGTVDPTTLTWWNFPRNAAAPLAPAVVASRTTAAVTAAIHTRLMVLPLGALVPAWLPYPHRSNPDWAAWCGSQIWHGMREWAGDGKR